MFTTTNSFTYIAFMPFLSGGLLALEKYAKWKVFNIVPPLVWLYLLNMVFCTLGMYDSEGCSAAYSAVKDNLLYGMIFVMLLGCDFRKLAKLSGRMIAIFLGGSFTLAVGTIVGYPIFKGMLGQDTWAAVAALFASWVGGSPNMAAMQTALPVDPGAYGCALALDTVCYSLWIALLLLVVRYADRWDKAVKADTSKLAAVAEAANKEVEGSKRPANGNDWVIIIGLSLLVSAFSQRIGDIMGEGMASIGLEVFSAGTCTTVFVTIVGLICALTPLGRLPAIDDLSTLYLYVVIALLSSTATVVDLVEAPMWVIYGIFILVVHVILMFVLSKLFHLDLCMVSTASLANIGGSGSAPIVASTYNPAYAGIGVLMGVLGATIGNFCGIGMGWILHILA